jgi:hypothetical protein
MFSQTQLPLTSSSNQGMKATAEKKKKSANDNIGTNPINLSNAEPQHTLKPAVEVEHN